MSYKNKYLKYKEKYLALKGGSNCDNVDDYVNNRNNCINIHSDKVNNLKVIYFDPTANYKEPFFNVFCNVHNILALEYKIPESNIFGIFNLKDIGSKYDELSKETKEKPNIVHTLAKIPQRCIYPGTTATALHFNNNDKEFDLSNSDILERVRKIADSIYHCNPLFLDIFKNNKNNYILDEFDHNFEKVVKKYNEIIVPHINKTDNVILIIKSHGEEDKIKYVNINIEVEIILDLFKINCNKLFYIPHYCKNIFSNDILTANIRTNRTIYNPKKIFVLSNLIKHPLIDDLHLLSKNEIVFKKLLGGLFDETSKFTEDENILQNVLKIINKYDVTSFTAWQKHTYDEDFEIDKYNDIKGLPDNIVKLEKYFEFFKYSSGATGEIEDCFNILLKYYKDDINPYEKLVHFGTLYDCSGEDVLILFEYIKFIVNNVERQEIDNIFKITINKTIDWINTNNKLKTIDSSLWATRPIIDSEFNNRDILTELQRNFIL